ncbi:MAG: hypothetical protein IEMM0002_0414 [bacterium]|nr:MAG: hypothetical protein IEMM0002_0414 [bacterium]
MAKKTGLKNKREAVRVETAFPVEFRLVDEGEIVNLTDEIANHSTDDRLGLPPSGPELPTDIDSLKDYQGTSPQVMKMWVSIDQKLDALMKIIVGKAHGLPEALKGAVKDISSKGIRIKSATKLAVGRHILLRMTPPMFPSFTIDAVGKVLDIVSVENDGKSYNVEFVALNPDDRELLVTYVFKRQREILRHRSAD